MVKDEEQHYEEILSHFQINLFENEISLMFEILKEPEIPGKSNTFVNKNNQLRLNDNL